VRVCVRHEAWCIGSDEECRPHSAVGHSNTTLWKSRTVRCGGTGRVHDDTTHTQPGDTSLRFQNCVQDTARHRAGLALHTLQGGGSSCRPWREGAYSSVGADRSFFRTRSSIRNKFPRNTPFSPENLRKSAHPSFRNTTVTSKRHDLVSDLQRTSHVTVKHSDYAEGVVAAQYQVQPRRQHAARPPLHGGTLTVSDGNAGASWRGVHCSMRASATERMRMMTTYGPNGYTFWTSVPKQAP
jgi:hypothetical protein